MNRSRFIIALTATAACAVAYEIRENPALTPANSSLASVEGRSLSSLANDLKFSASSASNSGQDIGETSGSGAAGWSREVQSLAAGGGSKPPSSGSTADSSSEAQPDSSQAPLQQAATMASAGVEVSHPAFPVSIPLAFRPMAPGAAAANPQLAAAVQGLQQQFVAALGGPNQDPNDPTYAQRWTIAQRNIDEQYRLLVGDQEFLLYNSKGNGGASQ
jgi:hypothetical protein